MRWYIALGSTVVRNIVSGYRVQGRVGSYVDDVTMPLLDQQAADDAAAVDDPANVQVELPLHLVFGLVQEGVGLSDATGVVDQDVDAAKLLHGRIGQSLDRLGSSHICLLKDRKSTRLNS